MAHRRTNSPTHSQGPARPDGSYVTVRELDARVDEIKGEMKWHKWLLFGLVAATISPKLGGPAAPALTAEIIRHIT